VTRGVARPGPGAPVEEGPAPAVVPLGRPPWWLVAVAAAVVVAVTADLLGGGRLEGLDLRISAAVGRWDLRHGPAYPVFWLGTELGGRGFILVVLTALVGWLAARRRTVLPLLRLLLALVLLTGVVYAFKYGAGRTAPAYPGSYFHRDGASFPSGHVANAVLMWGLARWQSVEYGLPAGWQRLFGVLSIAGPVVAAVTMVSLNFHWLSDVVAGAAVGIVLLGLVHALDGVALRPWVHARAGRRSA
jgi:membrane-associated phospholipid phosphatase